MNTKKDKTKESKKDKEKGRITKENIGLPQTFLHVDHTGWSTNSWIDVESPKTVRRRKADYEINTKDPAVKAWFASNNITEADLKNPSKAVNDLIKQHGGMAAIKKKAEEFFPVEILARGAEALNAFNEALEEGETDVNQARTIFIGLERVGKTSTINSFLGKDLNKDEKITDAMVTKKLMCTQDAIWKEKSHDLSGIYDDALVDEVTKRVLKISDEATSVPSVTQQRMEKQMIAADKMTVGDNQASEIPRCKESGPDAERKMGKQQEKLPENIVRKVAKNINDIKFTRKATSGWQKTGKDFIINIWDFGGQPIYHVIQRIFLVSFSIVCVVFNLEDDLDAHAQVRDPTTGKIYQHRMTNLQFILY
ncbi:uncharacterized protein LOC117112259 [Anneissia japonica]|uniref:uncharacterized protein LOC117112259 n=1 Tax=Anneissia japonica TaxID=1529436 RepID=UPI0014255FBF|nr:uncharacterized protein LOC117112259 [Anneissia japonica]